VLDIHFIREHPVVLADDPDTAVEALGPLMAPEHLQRHGIHPCIVHILGDLDQVVDLLHDLGDFGLGLHQDLHQRMVLADPAVPEECIGKLDIVIHLLQLAGEFTVIKP